MNRRPWDVFVLALCFFIVLVLIGDGFSDDPVWDTLRLAANVATLVVLFDLLRDLVRSGRAPRD